MIPVAAKNAVLKELLDTRTSYSTTGNQVEMHSYLIPEYTEALYQTVLQANPKLVVEVGMAFGISSLAILTALEECGGEGRLISIDPYQLTDWQGCGVTSLRRAGLQDRHELIAKFDYIALPQLLEQETRIDFAYIDGWHTFDYTLLDFWYFDKMLPAGAMVAFNDCSYKAVQRVLRFVQTHRKYEEVDVGLAPFHVGRSRKQEVKRRLMGQSLTAYYDLGQDRYFRKTEEWEPAWDFYAEF